MIKVTLPRNGFGVTAMLILVVGLVYGYISNIIKIFGLFGQEFNTVAVELIIRGIGVFVAPFGAIAGYF